VKDGLKDDGQKDDGLDCEFTKDVEY